MPTQIKHKIGSGAPLASDLIEGELGLDTVNGRAYTENSVGSIVELGTNPAGEIQANAGIALPDSQKATFGASDDLQIYHDGTKSYITDSGTGDLQISGDNDVYITNAAGTEYKARFISNGAAQLYYDSYLKLATTSTGVDVTGTVTADGLTVDKGSEGTYVLLSGDNASGARGLSLTSSTNYGSNGAKHTINAKSSSGGIALATNSLQRALFDYNGDISFYEDTGTTAKFFWDASAESLGIGTSSPAAKLDVLVGSDQRLLFTTVGTDTLISGVNAANSAYKTLNLAGSEIVLRPNGTERLRIDSSGNVGIGTSSPVANLHVSGNGGSFRLSNTAATTNGDATFSIRASVAGVGYNNINNIAWEHRFSTGATEAERARIDSSGNLLVGKTTANTFNSTAGHEQQSNGLYANTRDGGIVQILNRLTSDGDIAVFRKDGTTVGSIGTNSAVMYIGSDDVGFRFDATSNAVSPWNTTSAALNDGGIDIGRTTARFRNLYLSGGVYLGGTGAANHLDDYEEGTWTPTISGTTSGSVPITTVNSARYTKVGNLVTIQAYLSNIAGSSSTAVGPLVIGGLPFTCGSEFSVTPISHSNMFSFDEETMAPCGYTNSGQTTIQLVKGGSNNAITAADVVNSSGLVLMIVATYRIG